MSVHTEVEVAEWPIEKRGALKEILDESFEGWYLYHAKRKLMESEEVLVASDSALAIGLSMLELLDKDTGYVFYIAVRRTARGHGVGALLLEKSLDFFQMRECKRVFAAVENDNLPSQKLFISKGFTWTNFTKVSKMYGQVHALVMYSRMVVVPGESLLVKTFEA